MFENVLLLFPIIYFVWNGQTQGENGKTENFRTEPADCCFFRANRRMDRYAVFQA
jgi:hypothetical protein